MINLRREEVTVAEPSLNLASLRHCPRCNKPLVRAIAIDESESPSWLECPECGTLVNTYRPTYYQAAFLQDEHRYRMTSGGYGCTALGTPILMYDGSMKKVEDVIVGDRVMGPDRTPRIVLALHRGQDAMYILRTKTGEVKVNLHHIMHLRVGWKVINIPLIDFLVKPKAFQKRARLVHYEHYTSEFTVEEAEYGDYYGFELSGDRLYVEGNTFTVHHNSGKSRTNIEDVMKHILLIKNARVVVAARTYPALEVTFVKEFFSMFPKKLMKRKNDTKREVSFVNGSEIIFRSFDDPTKLKSMNVTMAVIIEGSDCPETGFSMLQSRLRNVEACIPEYDAAGNVVMYWDERIQEERVQYRVDARKINIETNPDSGWVKEFLLDSGTVEFYGSAHNENYHYKAQPDPNKYTQVVSTDANPHLPVGYEEEQTRGKPPSYVMQMFRGSFNFSANLVFPNFGVCIVPPHALPDAYDDKGRRALYYLVGLDYGISDPTHIIFAAFSTITKKLYVYDELRIRNSDVKTIAKEYRKAVRMNGTDLRYLMMLPRFDGRSYNKRESDLYTIGGMFEAEGLFFEPSFANHEPRILKLNALINHDQLEVFSTCEFLIHEGLNYKYKVDRKGEPTRTPVDGKDHGIAALEFIVVELPHNLKELRLTSYLPSGAEIVHDKMYIEKTPPKVFDPLKEDTNANVNVHNNSLTAHRNTTLSFASTIYDMAEDDEDDNTPGGDRLGAYIPGK